MTAQDFEIMAPVGSYESLTAAIQGGAHSIYFGVEGLNMRARSSNNFTLDDLREIARICREHGLKSYLTVNTVIYDSDIDLMRRIIDAVREAGISAIIASDIAAMTYARSIGVEVHLSTQLNITNVEALEFYARYADVVVLARELNLDQVAHIYAEIERRHITGPSGKPVRIEMFAHGALCMAVSGKCYLSLHEMNASANRGACMQVCRRGYTVRDKESDIELDIDNQYILSPKDLKTIHFINRMMEAGVRVFKIEGRARSAEYVRTVVECYRQAVESVIDGSYGDEKIAAWDTRLAQVFNRGFWNGYYLGQRLGEWSHTYGSEATRVKVYIGQGGEILLQPRGGRVCRRDPVAARRRRNSSSPAPRRAPIITTVKEMRVDLKPVERGRQGRPRLDKARPEDTPLGQTLQMGGPRNPQTMKRETPVTVITDDGTPTLYLPGLDEHYHSVRGAVAESMHVYIKTGLEACRRETVDLFECGFGTGLNAFLTLLAAGQSRRHIHYTVVEAFPLDATQAYRPCLPRNDTAWQPPPLRAAAPLRVGERGGHHPPFSRCTWSGPTSPATLWATKATTVIYYDAFAPEKQPELWSAELLGRVARSLRRGGVLSTYCAKGEVRRRLQQAGLVVQRTPGPPGGKREILQAPPPRRFKIS